MYMNTTIMSKQNGKQQHITKRSIQGTPRND